MLGTAAVETLQCDLLSLNQPCAFLDILVAPLDKITHGHSYSLPSEDKERKMMSNSIDATSVYLLAKGLSVQHIQPNPEWQKKHIPKLESYFDDYILPEFASPQHKPNYYL